MIKPLVELIEAVTDVEEKAHEHVRSQDCEVMDDYSSHEDTFKAGARSQACLAEALKLAVECLEDVVTQTEDHGRVSPFSVELRQIRDILEKETSE